MQLSKVTKVLKCLRDATGSAPFQTIPNPPPVNPLRCKILATPMTGGGLNRIKVNKVTWRYIMLVPKVSLYFNLSLLRQFILSAYTDLSVIGDPHIYTKCLCMAIISNWCHLQTERRRRGTDLHTLWAQWYVQASDAAPSVCSLAPLPVYIKLCFITPVDHSVNSLFFRIWKLFLEYAEWACLKSTQLIKIQGVLIYLGWSSMCSASHFYITYFC